MYKKMSINKSELTHALYSAFTCRIVQGKTGPSMISRLMNGKNKIILRIIEPFRNEDIIREDEQVDIALLHVRGWVNFNGVCIE